MEECEGDSTLPEEEEEGLVGAIAAAAVPLPLLLLLLPEDLPKLMALRGLCSTAAAAGAEEGGSCVEPRSLGSEALLSLNCPTCWESEPAEA